MGTAIMIARSCAEPRTTRVTGRRWRMSVFTSTRLTNENPQSPRSMDVNHRAYRTGSGSSRPNFARRFWRTSGGTFGFVASSSKGSPGARASTANSTTLMPSSAGMETSALRSRYLDMHACGYACLDQYASAQKSESQPILTASRSLREITDRKSTRLNSSHTVISYAVFCLKKKKNNKIAEREYKN